VRTILVTGKGGVGKTSVAAATALRAARLGHRTLVMSTDPAHSLGDALEVGLGDGPTEVAERLDAEQLDPHVRLEHHWADVRSYLVSLMQWGGLDEVQAEELSLLPGLEELFALVDVRRHAAAGRHDVLVVDCAPTAETLRLLSLPDALGWYLERAFGLERTFARVVRPVLGRVTSMPMPSDAVVGSVERLYRTLADVRQLLLDGDRTTVRLVTNAERVVVAETRRTFTALHLFGYHVDALVVNRLLPDAVTDPYFADWRARQAAHLRTLRTDFDVPVLGAAMAPDEVVGLTPLDALADDVYAGADPAAVLHRTEPIDIARDGDEVVLTVALPFSEEGDVGVFHRADELFVRVGPHTRNLVLPALLRRGVVRGAALRDGRLVVRFTVAPAGLPQATHAPGTAR
jgi:arsenite/tail-anchored protein-transporting ATPase